MREISQIEGVSCTSPCQMTARSTPSNSTKTMLSLNRPLICLPKIDITTYQQHYLLWVLAATTLTNPLIFLLYHLSIYLSIYKWNIQQPLELINYNFKKNKLKYSCIHFLNSSVTVNLIFYLWTKQDVFLRPEEHFGALGLAKYVFNLCMFVICSLYDYHSIKVLLSKLMSKTQTGTSREKQNNYSRT